MVSFPFGEERGEGADFVQVDKELLVTSFMTSDNLQKELLLSLYGGGKKDDLHFAYMVTGTYLMDDLPGTAFLSSFGQVTSTDGCFLLL